MSPSATLDNTWGAAFVGLILSAVLYGIATIQTYLYYMQYPNDSRGNKLLAASVWFLVTISLGIACGSMYEYLVTDIIHPKTRTIMSRALDVDPVLVGIIGTMAHGYLGIRVWKVCNRNFWFGFALTILALSNLGLNIASCVVSFTVESWSDRSDLRWIAVSSAIVVVALDTSIASVLCLYLYKQDIQGKGTKRIVRSVLILTINTGLFSSILSIYNAVTYFTLPNTLAFLGSYFVFAKVYANAVLANLNARNCLRGKGHTEESTLSLNLSALLTNPGDVVVLIEDTSRTSHDNGLSNVPKA